MILSTFHRSLSWRLRNLGIRLKTIINFIREEKKYSRKDLTLYEKLRAWREGFTSESYVIYGLQEKDRDILKDYLSDMARFIKPSHIDNEYKYILLDKVVFAAMMAFNGFSDCIPCIRALIFRGKIHPLHGSMDSIDKLWRYCEAGNGLVLKPIKGEGGRGVALVSSDSGHILLNGQQITLADLSAYIAKLDVYLVQQTIKQAGYANRIFPGSINTIRLVTMWDSETDQPFITVAVHRFGTMHSMPVDNVDKGGLSASIDLETGHLGFTSTYPRGKKMIWFDHHPDTQAPIAGVQIPGWTSIKQRILDIAKTLPCLPYVGWDILLDQDGHLIILEGNHKPGMWILQMHGPLMKNPKVRRFYKTHQVI